MWLACDDEDEDEAAAAPEYPKLITLLCALDLTAAATGAGANEAATEGSEEVGNEDEEEVEAKAAERADG